MTRAFPLWPGVPAGGHVTTGGHWHPGSIATCHRCHDCPPFPHRSHATRVRYLHHIEAMPGWLYRATLTDPLDYGTEPPAGKGWEVNVDAGNDGYAVTTQGDGTEVGLTYWRKYVGRAGEP